MNLQHKDLNSLPLRITINADDIANLSGQNRVKGIHPITHSDFRGVVILCTIGGENYANEWLNDEHTKLKYYLEELKLFDFAPADIPFVEKLSIIV